MDRDTAAEMTPHLKRASSVDCDKSRPIFTSTPEVLESITGSAAIKQRLFKDHQEPNGNIRRCLSETQVVEGGSCSSVSSETSSSSGLMGAPEVFPSLPEVVLQQLGLVSTVRVCDVLSEQDVESRFSSLALAFKTDKLTLVSRHDRQQRQRDQAERNMATEVTKLRAAVHNLHYLCKDSESIEILSRIQDQVDVLQRSTERVSTSAEIYGAVQQESRVSKAIEVMLLHVDNLKRMYEKEHTELEETKRVLLENNIVLEGSVDTIDVTQTRSKRYNSLVTYKDRRASIAGFARPLGSPDSSKSSSSSLTFGDIKSNIRTLTHIRRLSLSPTASHIESPTPGWDRSDRLDRQEVVGGSMENIKEVVGVRRNSASSAETRISQQKSVEENNNSRKSSRSDCPVLERLGFSDSDNEGRLSDMAEESSPVLPTEEPEPVKTFRENATDFICRTHMAVLDRISPLNVDYVLSQTRRCATVLLLVAALWSLVSTFVPSMAQSRTCIPFSWITAEEVLRPFLRVRHYGPPPT